MAKADQLKALLDELPGRTLAAKLQDLMPEIDRKVRSGVRHEEIIEVLNAQGFDLKLTNFRSILYRYRKKHPGNPGAAPAKQQNGNSGQVRKEEPDHDSLPAQVQSEAEPSLDEMLSNEQSREDFTNQFMTKRPIRGKKQ
ncbi:MAG: hypothetical protein E6R08_07055 [Nevskiaceae bacterium]|nr:MAG: hypothetical protein E6R08_07055 [Nevskiaceae bacterium]